MSDPVPGHTNGDGTAGSQEIRVQVLGQYVKDLSFENPGAPSQPASRPQIDLAVDLQARGLDAERFEVELKLRVTAKVEEKALFLLELVYAGLFGIANAPQEIVQQFLLIEAPHILFPFARRVIADVTRDGGMPPLLVEPIDFSALYRAKQEQAQQGAPAIV